MFVKRIDFLEDAPSNHTKVYFNGGNTLELDGDPAWVENKLLEGCTCQ